MQFIGAGLRFVAPLHYQIINNNLIEKVMSIKSKVAIIGLGNIGKTVAQNLVKGNRPVIIASHKLEDAKVLAHELGSLATASETREAIKNADIVVLSVWFNTIHELFEQYGTELQGKIIVDPSNPIAPDENGGFKKIIDADQSAGQINATLLPKNAKLAKALGSLGAGSLAAAAHQQPEPATLFYATDDTTINTQIEELISDSGFAPVRIGDLSKSIRMEVFGDLHEFGALGKTVTASVAKEKI